MAAHDGTPTPELRARVATALGREPVRWHSPHTGLSAALSTLPLEGGPDPFDVMPRGGAWAAWHAGIAARRAYRETQAPPWLRRVFRRIAAICLAWSARSLDLPPGPACTGARSASGEKP